MSALSMITAQNTLGVHGVSLLKPEFLQQQIEVVADDIGVDALKTGFLATKDLIQITAQSIAKEQLFNQATIITPNVRETSLLTNTSINNCKDVEQAATELLQYGSQAVLIKGGYLEERKAADYLKAKDESLWLYGTPIDTKNTHGSGDTLSAALATYLAQGLDLFAAFKASKDFLQKAIEAGASRQLGSGQGGLKQNFN